MKKRILSIVMVLALLCSVLSVSAYAAHECVGSGQWTVEGGKCWQACTDATCTLSVSEGEHVDSAEDTDFVCDNCSQHICTYSADWTSDENGHWYACLDTGCTAAPAKTSHEDTSGDDGKCDTCAYQMTVISAGETISSLVISGLDAPALNQTPDLDFDVDFTVESNTQVERSFGMAWQMLDSLEADEPAVMSADDTFAAGKIYIAGVVMELEDTDKVSDAIEIVLNGEEVPYYASEAAFDAAMDAYDGTANIAGATVFTDVDGVKCLLVMAAYKILEEPSHVHAYADTWSHDGDNHWKACSCGAADAKAAHADENADGKCDVCGYEAGKVHTQLNITDLTVPADGVKVDFTANAAPAEYGKVSVYWNKVNDASKNDTTALAGGATYAAGNLYTTGILVYVGSGYTVSEDLKVTLNGTAVTFYPSADAANEAAAKYDGSKDVGIAFVTETSSGTAVMVGMMYAKLDGTHTHSYGTDWAESDTQHWHECACGAKTDVADHTDANNTKLCDVCGHKVDIHTHAYTADYVESATQHWKQCATCGGKTEVGTHYDGNHTGKCDVCGYVMTSSCTSHTYGSDYVEDAVHHWKQCTVCGIKTGIEAHYDNNNTNLCDDCGYAMTNPDTGDSGMGFLWGALLIVSLIGAGMSVTYLKKKEKE